MLDTESIERRREGERNVHHMACTSKEQRGEEEFVSARVDLKGSESECAPVCVVRVCSIMENAVWTRQKSQDFQQNNCFTASRASVMS